ncbi:hypothetical protein L596_028714 [Steinernema carpocapsae]|uniref:Oxidoreductase FAD/NAD(P)-binding domain-containing protein n=1 Tax=Steinernema carpocapsae TaxID=34508 RepID=A0A4U5LZ65_STECR|nr:hypothetical protein L596_028714 [Steinernema carpocapsae]
MIAGGTGITPIYPIIRAILTNPEDKTGIVLLYASRDENNIVLKKELDELQEFNKDQFKLHYVVENASKDSSHERGQITEELIKKTLPMASKHKAVLLCGPPAMINFVCIPAVDGLGYSSDQTYIF